MNPSNSNGDVELRKAVAVNMGLYYRESDGKWLREIFEKPGGKFLRVENMTAELDSVMQLIQAERIQAAAEAYESCETWLNDKLTGKADVAGICEARKKVLRGEMEAPTSRFASNPEQPKEDSHE